MEDPGFRIANYQNSPSTLAFYRPSPPHPFTAIDRFLWGSQSQSHNVMNKGSLISSNGVFEFSPNSSGIIGSGFDQENGGACSSIMQMKNYSNVGYNEEEKLDKKNYRGMGRRSKGNSFKTLIKGQWTDDEDMMLLSLVKQHGVRKWALIGEKMIGRDGKQCRARWHNHLRPDIKKDTWSEEEERALIEAHKNIGNKWTEIAKQIPGRTENSIKNHWNATKRRRNSRRKSKKSEGQNKKSKTSLLQDYIRSQSSPNVINISTTTTTMATTTTNSTISDDSSIKVNILYPELTQSISGDDHSDPLDITHTYDYELSFMQSFFGANSSEPNLQNAPLGFINGNVVEMGYDQSSSLTDHPNMCYVTNVAKELEAPKTHLCPDLYLSYLLDGATSIPSLPSSDYISYEEMKIGGFASSSDKKDLQNL